MNFNRFNLSPLPLTRLKFSKPYRTNFKLSIFLLNKSVKMLVTLRERTLILAFNDIPDCKGTTRPFTNSDCRSSWTVAAKGCVFMEFP